MLFELVFCLGAASELEVAAGRILEVEEVGGLV